jgi:ribosome-associated protein
MAKAKAPTLDAQGLAHKAAALLFAKKADEAVLLDLRGLSSLTDFYLICTCSNEAQMRGILNSVYRALSREGFKALRSEYHSGVRWAVLDYGDLIIHLFEKDTRNYYSLERLWADAKATKLKPEDYATEEEKTEDEDEDL